jgi:hypothetical protein
MAVCRSTRDSEPVRHDSNTENSAYELVYNEIEPSALDSVYHEIDDVDSACSSGQQQVESEEPGYLQPVNNSNVQMPYQEAAGNTQTGHYRSERNTRARCHFSRLVIQLNR